MNDFQRNARHLMTLILSLLAAATLLASAALPANAAAPKAPTLRRTISTGMSAVDYSLGGLQLSPDGRFVAAAVDSGWVITDTRTGDRNSMTGDMVLFAANGTLAYIGDSKKGTVEIYDTAKHTVKDTIHRQAGDQLFSVSEDGDMLLFYTHPSNGSPFYTTYRISKGTAATFERNTKGGELTSDMHISKDGTTIYATAGAPGDSHLVAWDANTGKQSFSTRIPDTTDGSFIQGFANKGRSLIIYVYGNADGDGFKIVRYNIDTKQFTKLADSDGRLLGFNSQCSQFTYLQKASNGATGSSSNAHDLETEDTMSGKITHSIKAPRALTDSETAAGLSADGSILYFVSYTKIRGESGDGQKPAEYTSVLHAMNLADGSTSEASQSIFGEVMLSADDSTLVQYTDPASDAFYNNVDSKRGIYVFNTHLPRNTVASATNSKLAVPLPLLIGTAAAVVILIAAAITLLLHRRHRVRARVNANATATAQTGAGAPSGGSPQFAQPAQPSQPIWPGTANQPYTADQPGMANQPSQPSQQPVQSVISAQPIQPVAPAQFAMPAEPVCHTNPAKHTNPAGRSKPDQCAKLARSAGHPESARHAMAAKPVPRPNPARRTKAAKQTKLADSGGHSRYVEDFKPATRPIGAICICAEHAHTEVLPSLRRASSRTIRILRELRQTRELKNRCAANAPSHRTRTRDDVPGSPRFMRIGLIHSTD